MAFSEDSKQASSTSSKRTSSPFSNTTGPRIVAIGASAGGLEALEQFFARLSAESGMAYIVVQHLDPTQKTLLPELLQRFTAMPVREAAQNMPIEANSVYVIPPNRELSVVGNILKLADPTEPRGLRLPIDVLFSSLAGARGERAIAVVLSGMGSDGTLGLQAVKAVGGLTLAQTPESAEYDSMPRSATEANCVNIIAPPGELPARIFNYLKQVSDPTGPTESEDQATISPLKPVIRSLQRQIRHDFSLYKPNTLYRRIERRMAIHDIDSLKDYAKLLEKNRQEADLLFKELLIGVTQFYRDKPAWKYLTEKALPDLLARRQSEGVVRAWVVGCSTGEEAFSLAMELCDAINQLDSPETISVKVFASDLSPDAIALARKGRFPLSIANSVPADKLERYFTKSEDHYRVNQNLRDMVLFAQHDVILDPPFTNLDIILCRNLLIYFDTMLQRRLIPLFHYSLGSDGLLLLGSSETVGRQDHLFKPVESKLRLYQRQNHASISGSEFLLKSFPPFSTLSKEHSLPSSKPTASTADSLHTAVSQLLLQNHTPAALLLNGDGDIVHINGRTGKYLEPAAGKANWNFHSMARDELREPLLRAIKKANGQGEPIHLNGLRVSLLNGAQFLNATVQTLQHPEPLKGMTLILFRDTNVAEEGDRRQSTTPELDSSLEAELQRYRDEIKTLRDEAIESREELQASNEKLQSMNEELQSANEELTTSKEEMQSMNEELQTINRELETKLEALSRAESDMQNVLNSTEIAILFLDQNLNIRRYTDRAAKIISLRDSDVGRPLSDLTTSLQYPSLHEDALATLRTLAFSEKQIPADDGRWHAVRIMPYRRFDNVIDGVVITLVDITESKKLESTLREESAL